MQSTASHLTSIESVAIRHFTWNTRVKTRQHRHAFDVQTRFVSATMNGRMKTEQCLIVTFIGKFMRLPAAVNHISPQHGVLVHSVGFNFRGNR